ncbi:MAG: hypothetical protein KA247_06230 [Bacteroidetes bacterium]|nr:hypothetical protein [Bacteroidota bacterium]
MKQAFTLSATIAVITLIAVHITTAQEPVKKYSTEKAKIEFATKNILSCLATDNDGVIESAMRLTAEMKILYPHADMTKLISAMNSIKKNHPNGAIRYKAFVAISVCENPEWYARLMESYSENNDTFFRSASGVLNEQLLTQAN